MNALEEVLANRQLGTLVVIAAQEVPSTGSLSSPAGSYGGSADSGGTAATQEQSEKQQRRALRLGTVKWEAESEGAPSNYSRDSGGANNGGSLNTGPSRRFRLSGQNLEATTGSLQPAVGRPKHPTKRFDRETFVRVSRIMGDDVLFGEISDPEVVEYYLDVHVRPYMQTRLEMAHTHVSRCGGGFANDHREAGPRQLYLREVTNASSETCEQVLTTNVESRHLGNVA